MKDGEKVLTPIDNLKAVFVNDHNFFLDPENNFIYDGSGGVFDQNLWKRYLGIFEELLIIGRKTEVKPEKLNLSSFENVDFFLLKNPSSLKNRFFNYLSLKKTLKKIILKYDFAIIRLPSYLGAIAFEICYKYKIKYVLEVVADPFTSYRYHGSLLGNIIAPYERYKLKSILQKAQNVIYVTQEKLQDTYPNLNNNIGISNVRLTSVAQEDEVEKFYLNLKNEKFTIGLIGTFHARYKGHVELLKAIQYLVNKGRNDIKVLLVGTGDPSWFRELVAKSNMENYFEMVGVLESGEKGIIPFLDKLDCYAHPSLTEGLPRVVLEAMSRGKICVTSDAGGVKEFLDEKFIHKAGDWHTLATHIENIILSDDQTKLNYALDNLKKSEEYLEVKLQARRTEFIEKILKDDRV